MLLERPRMSSRRRLCRQSPWDLRANRQGRRAQPSGQAVGFVARSRKSTQVHLRRRLAGLLLLWRWLLRMLLEYARMSSRRRLCTERLWDLLANRQGHGAQPSGQAVLFVARSRASTQVRLRRSLAGLLLSNRLGPKATGGPRVPQDPGPQVHARRRLLSVWRGTASTKILVRIWSLQAAVGCAAAWARSWRRSVLQKFLVLLGIARIL